MISRQKLRRAVGGASLGARSRILACLLLALCLAALPQGAWAESATWEGAVDNVYNEDLNWAPAITFPGTGPNETATFNNDGHRKDVSITAATANAVGFTFSNTAGNNYTITLATGVSQGLTGVTTTGTGDVTLARAGTGLYVIGNVVFSIGAGQNTTVSAPISESLGGTLVKSGSGTLTLSGVNLYSSGTTLTAGTLAANNNWAFGNGAVALNGGTLLNSSGAAKSLHNNNTVAAAGTPIIGGTAGNNLTLNGNIALGAGSTLTNTNAADTTLSGVISGDTGSIVQNSSGGAGVLTLSGNNTYSGTTTLTAGTLAAGHNNALGTGGLTINGGTLQAATGTTPTLGNAVTVGGDFAFGGADALTLSGTVDLGAATRTLTLNNTANTTLSGIISNGGLTTAGTGTLTLGGVNTYTGATTIGAGSTLALNATGTIAASSGVANEGTFTIAADKTIDSLTGTGATTLGGILTIGDATGTSGTYSGVASGAGGITKEGAGTLTLSGANTYTGNTTLTAGTLIAGSSSIAAISGPFGTTAGTLIINGGTLYASGTRTVANAVTVGADFNTGGALLTDVLTLSGATTLTGDRTISVNGLGSTVISGIIGETGGARTLTVNNTSTGTLTLSGVNTYSGGTTLTAGSLYVGNDNALGSGTLTINGGNFQATAGIPISVGNAITVGGNFAIGGNSSLTLTGDVDLGGATRTITLNNTSDLTTLSGVVSNGGLTTAGAETLTLGGVNTYTGATTIGAGSTLALNATGTIATSSGVANAGTFTIAADKTIDSLTGAGGTTLGGILTIGDGSGTSCTYSGVASGAGGITKAGSGTLTLSGNNTYSGTTTLTAGTLLIGHDNALGNAGTTSLTIGNGTTLGASAANINLGVNAITVGGAFSLGNSSDGTASLSLTQALALSDAAYIITHNGLGIDVLAGAITGTGGITQETGTLFLVNGGNTYSGSTTITGGTLDVRGAHATGTGAMVFTGGTLLNGSGEGVTLDNGAITVGTGLAAQTATIGGAGNLTISTTTAGNMTLNTLATLEVTNTGTTTINKIIEGGGNITQNSGTGNLILSGANTYTGATTITSGTLTLDATGTIAASSEVANAGTFIIAADKTIDSLTGAGATTLGGILTIGDATGTSGNYSGVASGAGGITTGGTGTLTLSGINTFSGLTSVNSGTLDLTGSITGGGGVTVLSPGTFNLTATSALTGDVNNSGTVALNGTQTGAFTNNADATLTGSGIITGALVNNGTVNPGNSPGTLTVGSYTVNPGATHVVEIASATSYDKVVVTGAGGVTLNGGTLSPRLLGGYLPSANQIFTNIISNTGGGLVTGTFDAVEDSQTLGWRAIYNADSIDLQTYQEFAGLPGSELSVSLSANQRSVANMLNALPPASDDLLEVLNAIHALTTADGVRAAYNDISPQKYAALPTLAFPVTHMQFQYLLNRLARQRWEAQLGQDAVSSGGGGFLRGFNFGYDNTKMLLASNTFTLSDAGNPLIRPGADHRWGIYLEPMANWGSLRPSANLVGYHYKNFGFILGADYWVTNNWLVGVNTGYSKTLTGIGGTGGDINANVIPFNAYTALFLKGFYANGTLGYTYSNYNMERNVAYGTINRTAQANTSGNQFQAAAETGYDFKAGNAIVGPTVTLQYATQTTGGFTESNAGALNLKVDSQTAYSLQTGVGARASYRAKVGNVTLKPQVSVAWQHEFSNDTHGVDARLAQGSTTMNWRTDKIGQNFAVVSVDVPARITKNLVANIGYTAEVGRAKSSNQGINLGLRYKF